jgi:hypothetical protein
LLRSTRFTFQILVAGLVLGASLAVGCSDQTAASDSVAPGAPLQEDGTSSGSTPKPIADASSARGTPYHGNPLCLADEKTCMPDDDGYQHSLTNVECAVLAPDAGDAQAADFKAKGCRIYGDKDTKVGPICLDAAPNGRDGESCTQGSDCAPGFDCVAGDRGSTCRHYCCGGTCKGNLSNGSATFCDVQSLIDVPQKAPVCMPLKRCSKLLGTGECATNESCTVVTESGDTGCVPIGDKEVGQSCDLSHCAAKLTCLGQPGARKCFKLCKVNASDCPYGQTCVTSAAFQDGDFGICQ